MSEFGGFELWLLEQLRQWPPRECGSVELAVWSVVVELLLSHGFRFASPEQVAAVQAALFDPASRGDTAHLTGFCIPDSTVDRLTALGFPPEKIPSFPSVAYRVSKIRERLRHSPLPTFAEVLSLADSFPLGDAESAARDYARERQATWLRREVEASGHVWTPKLRGLEELTTLAIEQRRSVREVARELANALRRHGIYLDSDALIRTEMARVRAAGNWQAESQRGQWQPSTLIFRLASTHACAECLRLYRSLDGTPRLYRVDQVRIRRCLWPNRGPRRLWVAKLGPTHKNCVCAPWQEYDPLMRRIFARDAPRYAELVRRYAIDKRTQ